MTIVTGLLLYAMIWTVTLFVVLPWGVRIAEHPDPGYAAGAPERPRVGLKLAVTSAVALVLWIVVFFIQRSGWVSFG